MNSTGLAWTIIVAIIGGLFISTASFLAGWPWYISPLLIGGIWSIVISGMIIHGGGRHG